MLIARQSQSDMNGSQREVTVVLPRASGRALGVEGMAPLGSLLASGRAERSEFCRRSLGVLGASMTVTGLVIFGVQIVGVCRVAINRGNAHVTIFGGITEYPGPVTKFMNLLVKIRNVRLVLVGVS